MLYYKQGRTFFYRRKKMIRIFKLLLLISMIIFIFTVFSFGNEKNSDKTKFSFLKINENNQNKSYASNAGYLDDLDYYAAGGSSDVRQKRAGIGFMAAGGSVMGFFYLLGIIVVAGSWAVVPKSASDNVPWGGSIGVSFIPLIGLYIVPYFVYMGYTNDGENFGSAEQTSTYVTVAAAVLLNFFQIAGFIMLIAGAVLYGTALAGTSKLDRIALLYYSERKLNNATYKYEDNMTLGISIRL